MATVYTESFDTTNSSTLGPDLTWTENDGDAQVVSNTCRVVGSAASTIATVDDAGSFTDGYVQAVIGGTDTDSPGVVMRYTDADNCIVAYIGQSAELRVRKYVAAALTQVVFASALGNGTVKLQIIGDALEVFHDGVSKGTADLAGDLPSGKAGICFRSPQASPVSTIDSFELSVEGAAGGGGPVMRLRKQRINAHATLGTFKTGPKFDEI